MLNVFGRSEVTDQQVCSVGSDEAKDEAEKQLTEWERKASDSWFK